MSKNTALGRFATRHSLSIVFICVALCLAGAYSALNISSSVFPQTNFPRVVILVDNGVMPADEMMATITRPIEEAMKDIPGVATVRSATGRGSAEVNVFFNWKVDMVQSELYVLGRLSQIRSSLPPTAEAEVYRVTFSNFPHYRHQPDEQNALDHRALGSGPLQPQSPVPADPRHRPRGPHRRPDARISHRRRPPPSPGGQPHPGPGHRGADQEQFRRVDRLARREPHALSGRGRRPRPFDQGYREFPGDGRQRASRPCPRFRPRRARPGAGLQHRHRRRAGSRSAQRLQPARREHARHRQTTSRRNWRL